jgi:hypothetical protein
MDNDSISGIREQLAAEKEHAAGAISAYRATLARLTDVEKECAAEKARADDLSRMVAECTALLDDVKRAEWSCREDDGPPSPFWGDEWQARIDAILSRPDVAAERGRWKTVEEHQQIVSEYRRIIRSLTEQRDAAITRAEKAEALTRRAVDVLVSEEMDRDFGEEPSARVMEVRAIMAECGMTAEKCSMGSTIGYSGTAAVVRERDEWKARAESAELGCDIAYRREPTQEEGDAHEDKQHQSMGPELATGECFVAMGGWTGRRCRHCNRWVWGGPTACVVCVEKAARDELGIQLAACQERLRLAMDAVRKLKAFRDGITFKVDEDRGVHSLRSIALDLERLWDESDDALAALDAVPGDALQPVSAAYKFDIGPALDRAHEASGVVTGAPFDEPQNGVKGVE